MKRIYTQERTGEVGRTVLGVVAIAGIIGIGMVAPNVVQLLPYTPLFRAQRRHYVNSVVGRCIERGLLKREQRQGIGTVLRLTPKGEALLARYQLQEIVIAKPKRWDKKYRIIIFDIKEARRSTRTLCGRNCYGSDLYDCSIACGFTRMNAKRCLCYLKQIYILGRMYSIS